MEDSKSLRGFLAKELGDAVARVVDRPRSINENFVEGFFIETKREVSSETLLAALQGYYPKAEIAVRAGGDYHWVVRPGAVTLLLDIKNYSSLSGGGKYWGGNPDCGGIGIVVTMHPEA